jgi:type I restriction enzyme S subunit
MKPYPKYKPSNIEWIGEIPEHWDLKKIFYCFRKISSGTTPKSDDESYYVDGEINWLNTGDLNNSFIYTTSKRITQKAIEEHSTLKIYPVNSIVIAMYGATIGKLGILKIETTTNQACCVLSDITEYINTNYIFSCLIAGQDALINLSFGGGQPNISQDTIRNFKLPIPPLTEQQAIAHFLDNKTAAIDQAIADKEALITLYEEEKKALINEAVTKGIKKNTTLKPSGIDWLGDIPTHWQVKRMRNIGRVNQGLQIPISERLYEPNSNTLKYITISTINSVNATQFYIDKYPQNVVCSENDILVARTGATGQIITGVSGVFHNNFFKFDFNKNIINKLFLFNFLITERIKEHLLLVAGTTTIPDLNHGSFYDIPILIPPLSEQEAIVQYIETASAAINVKIETTQQEINLLKEYRQALIFEAVTGKIDVR